MTREFVLQADFEAEFGIADCGNSVRADCIFNNVLLEYKNTITDTSAVVKQMARYTVALEHKGEIIPRISAAVSLSDGKIWFYDTDSIRRGGLSAFMELDLSNSAHEQQMRDILNKPFEGGVRYAVNARNITALAAKFYEGDKSRTKAQFMENADCEIRKPRALADRILPYSKSDNIEFSGVVDTLNPKLWQKELGAFFTPPHAVIAGQSLLLKAVKQYNDEGKDYVIIDRCAGTGNLYRNLPDEVYSHCYLSELEPVQRNILALTYQDTDAHILAAPHDGLSSVLPPHEGLKERIDEGAKVVIFENPPYAGITGGNNVSKHGSHANNYKKAAITLLAKRELHGVATNDICNIFIWSAFEAIKADKVIVYAPIKYWKAGQIVCPKFIDGFIVNREGFHASKGAITIIAWKGYDDSNCNEIDLKVFDMPYDNAGDGNIDKDYVLAAKDFENLPVITVERVNPLADLPSKSYEVYSGKPDEVIDELCARDGKIDKTHRWERAISYVHSDILAYSSYEGYNFNPFRGVIVRLGLCEGNGAYITKANAFYNLPYFAACHRKPAHWWEIDLLMRAYAEQEYRQDSEFLEAVLCWTAFTAKNKTRALTLSDGRFIQNELTPDMRSWLAGHIGGNKWHESLKRTYDEIIAYCRDKCEEPFDVLICYSVWELKETFDIMKETTDKKGKLVKSPKYPELRGKFKLLKMKTDKLYETMIEQKLFKYGFIR